MDATAKIKFPAILYHDPAPDRFPQYMHRLVRNLDELIVRRSRWPQRWQYVPGGLIDRTCQHFVIEDVMNLRPCPWWLKPLDPIFGACKIVGPYHLDLAITGPEQLTDRQAIEVLAKLVGKEKGAYEEAHYGRRKYQQLVRKAVTFRDAMKILYGDDANGG